MAFQVITKGTLLLGQYDLSGEVNTLNHLPVTRESLDSTVLDSGGWREFTGGIISAGGAVSGFIEDMDFNLDAALSGLSVAPISATLTNPIAEGDDIRAYQALETQFEEGRPVGQLLSWAGTFTADGPVARGFALHTGAETATGNATGQQLGAVSATQKAYAWMHVTATAGTSPTLDVIIESDATDSWSGSETTRFTFTQETDATTLYQWLTPISGAITDTWWRVGYTISGSAGQSFTFVVGLAIQ